MATLISNTVISLTGIDGTDCLGDSRAVINSNTTTIGQSISSLRVSISSLSANTSTQINNLSTVPYTRLNDGEQTGSAHIFGARAWVYFNGLSGLATLSGAEYRCEIERQGNVSKVLWLSAGQYDVYFQTALPADYAIIGSVEVGGNLENFIPRAAQSTAARARVNIQRNGIFEDANEIHALFIG